jgi:hypothetical protein
VVVLSFWLGVLVGAMFGSAFGVILMSVMNAASKADDAEAWYDMFRRQSNGDHHKG